MISTDYRQIQTAFDRIQYGYDKDGDVLYKNVLNAVSAATGSSTLSTIAPEFSEHENSMKTGQV